MTKKERKQIAQIAEQLPVVYEQTTSGYSVEDGRPVPYVSNHPINHERRMRKAFQNTGLDGIKKYLEYIRSLQDKRYARFRDAQGKEVHKESDGDNGLPDQEGLYDSGHKTEA